MCRHTKLINQAIGLTHKSEHDMPTGAIIALGKRPISWGVNKYKTHPKQASEPYKALKSCSGYYIHAELDAILGVRKEFLEGSTIYVARRRRDNTPGLAKPCQCCMNVIRMSGISRIIYTLSDSDKLFEEIVL